MTLFLLLISSNKESEENAGLEESFLIFCCNVLPVVICVVMSGGVLCGPTLADQTSIQSREIIISLSLVQLSCWLEGGGSHI